ncbi:MAG: 30S ribosomal protein S9 [Bdellovibrionales bacterium]|nr:30S ribosomal protein S9 [Bdellovibrionales bacterium]
MAQTKKFYYGTGRRKTSAARVFVKEGKGDFTVNKTKSVQDYFLKKEEVRSAISPLTTLNLTKSFDIFATVKGGGGTGQAEAIRHGLSRALVKVDKDFQTTLKKNGFLTRDSRMVERKKYGRRKARKSTQFSKR